MSTSEQTFEKYSVVWAESKRTGCKVCQKLNTRFCKRHAPKIRTIHARYYSAGHVQQAVTAAEVALLNKLLRTKGLIEEAPSRSLARLVLAIDAELAKRGKK